MQGMIDLDKPKGVTSHDCVAAVRRLTGVKKVGHAGTLDPMASGVLPICVGNATRIMQFLDDEKKEYICEMKLGVETDTLDTEGTVLRESEVTEEQLGRVKEVTESFKGDIMQVPPMYSALKYKGKSLYKYAREGQKIEVKPRKVHIYDIKVVNIKCNYVTYKISCGRGTYVRSVCRDIGETLGCGACMTALERTLSAGLRIEDSISLEELEKMSPEEIEQVMYPAWYPLDMEHVSVSAQEANSLIDGKKTRVAAEAGGDTVAVFEGDRFIGVCGNEGGSVLRPLKIFDTEKK